MAGNQRVIWRVVSVTSMALVVLLAIGLQTEVSVGQDSAGPPASASSGGQSASATADSALPRGEKLILTDGNFQLVREYKIEGDRVRYYSLERSQWEAIPVSLVDWESTKKAEAEQAQRDAAIVAKVHKQETVRAAVPLDIDASLEVAPGVFLPPGDHLFVYDGKAVLPLPQAETDSRFSKGHYIEQVMIPIPIVPTRHSISIQGAHAKLRISNAQPEFYIRVADAREPELVLIRTKVRGDSRHIENLDQLMGKQAETRDTVPIQPWEIARGVYRFTLGHELAPGEYAIAETIEDQGTSLYVWDFGVDASAPPAGPGH